MYIIGKNMNALEAYKIYLSIKLHFQRATYDISKHGMRANMPAEKFEAKTNMKLIYYLYLANLQGNIKNKN